MEKNLKVTDLSLQAKVIEYLTPSLSDPSNEDRFEVFLKWRSAFRANNPDNWDLVVIDEIPTELLADMYGEVLSKPESVGIAVLMKDAIESKRKENALLDKLCTEYESRTYDLDERRQQGRTLLLGK